MPGAPGGNGRDRSGHGEDGGEDDGGDDGEDDVEDDVEDDGGIFWIA